MILGLVEFAVREVAIDEDQKPKKPKPMPVVVDSEGELFLERFDDLRSEHPLGTVFLFEGSWRGAGDGGSGFDHFYFEQATSIGPRIGVAIENVLICGAFVPTLQIPHHQAEGYLQKLKSLGYCVAVVGSSTP